MDGLKKYMFLLVLMVSLLGLAVSFPSFFFSAIIRPIILVFWAVLRTLNSLDQSVYWIVLIAACSMLVLRLIPKDGGSGHRGSYQYRYRADSRIAYWQTLITNDVLRDEDANDLRDSLQTLLIAILPPSKNPGAINWENIATGGKIPLSLPARQFLFPPKETGRASSQAHRLKIIHLAPRWMRKWAEKSNPDDTILIGEILAWIENEMEISYDR